MPDTAAHAGRRHAVHVVLHPGFKALEAAGPLSVLAYANRHLAAGGHAGGYDIPALEAAMDRLSAACAGGTGEEIAEADFALHKAIVAAAGHGRLAAQYRLIEQQIRMYIRSSDALLSGGAEIRAQHVPIVEAILAGEAALAGRLSEDHNLSEGCKLSAHLAAGPAPD
ncbi:FCD domain-containing protein [Mangrovicoccus ximenensis]|uniref:FCD domain-containing protein n=1 Tax=Mangrovicoccus ximenensis TaxID=1911570 RepID=UPI000D35D038|nr:FCD domain-containing protein [Mangrovicoccus ximenensis]